MTITATLLVVSLAADPAPPSLTPPTAPPTAPPAAPPAARAPVRPPGAPAASLPTLEGEILEIDHDAHRIRLRTAEGELSLSFDRNTLVLGPGGAATPLLLTAGARVRAGRDGVHRASWVEVKPPPSSPGASP